MNSYSYTIDHTAEAFLTNLAGRGYREFELMVYPGHMWPKAMTAADRTKLRRHAESLGARIVTLNMPNIDVNIAAPPRTCARCASTIWSASSAWPAISEPQA